MSMPATAAAPVIEWKSPALEAGFFALQDLMDALNPHSETDLFLHLQTALDAIEAADCELEKFQ